MILPVIKAEFRIKINGSPVSCLKTKPVRELWLWRGHQCATTETDKKVVIERVRKEDKEKYTSKMFD